MIRRALILVWVFVFASIALLALFPSLAVWIPYPVLIRPFLLLLVLVSLAYGIACLYRKGMKRAERGRPNGETHHYDAPR